MEIEGGFDVWNLVFSEVGRCYVYLSIWESIDEMARMIFYFENVN